MGHTNTLQTYSLGLLGLGERSTQFYIKQLNNLYNKQYGQYSTCPFILLNSNFNHINPFLPQQFNTLEPILEAYINELSSIGVTQLIIPNITLHETYDRLQSSNRISAGIEIIHPVNTTLSTLAKHENHNIVLFASHYTMQSKVLAQQFNNMDITVITPSNSDMKAIDHIRCLLYSNTETAEDIKQFKDLIKHYQNTAPVVIACTELSIPLEEEWFLNKQHRLYDMSRLQIHAGFNKTHLNAVV